MFAKFLLVSVFIGYAAAACNQADFQSKCGKYGGEVQKLAAAQDMSKMNEMCCVLNEQVSCINDLGCGDALKQMITPAKAQIARMCGSYQYTKGCFAPAPAAEPAATTTDPGSGALSTAVPSLSLLLSITALLRAYN